MTKIQELVLYAVVIVIVTALMGSFDAFESFYQYTRSHETYELDELILTLPALIVCLCIFTFIRATRLKREMKLRRKAEDESKKIYRFYRSFMARVGHDMRTPLNGIIGMLQLIPLAESEAEKKEYLDLALSSSKNLNQLLGDILSISSLKRDSKPKAESFDLRQTLKGVVDLSRPMAEDKHMSLDLNIYDSVPKTVKSFEGPLRQMLINIVGNAIRYSPKGTVKITAEYITGANYGGNLVLAVEDEGPGIPESERESIFEPYVQGSNASPSGSGLGLSIVKRILGLVDGQIRVLDGKNGKGARFELTIPATPG